MTPDIKELFYLSDIRKHQQLVAERMIACAKEILDRGIDHDKSKFFPEEKNDYVDPVWQLNQKDIEYGSEEYKELVAKMGEGLKHHIQNNRHHPNFNDLAGCSIDLFDLIEMLCDWIAASKRKDNNPALAFIVLEEKYKLSEDLKLILKNTLAKIERM